ncbi:MAG: hypothetical protein CVV33_09985 [Methanomicrobiales archaeon HGW-Methanomicrobiales-4]|nr:MAG: hypothetical protein CVV33_09985 [Methanomicrobiales archaeon HGW-Methanomicrobiales-4]
MTRRVGIIWDTPVMFTRLVEDCGFIPELVTPHLLAAPFFRRSYSAIIIPGGFAHPSYSLVLPALRACEDRIWRFILAGGMVLVFGAGFDKPDAYDWLPVMVRYRFGFSEGMVEGGTDNPFSCIIEDCPDLVSIDGFFDIPGNGLPSIQGASDLEEDGRVVVCLQMRGYPVMIEYRSGAGRIILASLHEYPSRRFLSGFCMRGSETLL